MGQISTSIDIPAAPEKVWDIIASPNTYDSWLTTHTKWKSEIPERFSQGTTADEVVTMLGMANTISWTVVEFDEPKRLKIEGTGMAGVKTSFEFEVAPDGDSGSTATVNAEFVGSMIVGALGKAVETDAEKNLRASLAKLGELAS